MNIMDIIINSIEKENVCHFYIKHFKSIIEYLYLGNNCNKYYLILTDELETDIESINKILQKNKRTPQFDKKNLTIYCENEIQREWCIKYNFQYEINTNLPILESSYLEKIVEKPKWTSDILIMMKYYSDNKLKMFHLEALDNNWDIIKYLDNDTYIFVRWPGDFHKWLYEFNCNILFTLNKEFNKKNIIWLSPNLDGILFAYEYGFNAILCNPNAFTDYSKIKIYETAPILYKTFPTWDNPNVKITKFNRERIRYQFINMSNNMIQTFIDYTKTIFEKYNIDINADDYWNNTFFHRMIKGYTYNSENIKMLFGDNVNFIN